MENDVSIRYGKLRVHDTRTPQSRSASVAVKPSCSKNACRPTGVFEYSIQSSISRGRERGNNGWEKEINEMFDHNILMLTIWSSAIISKNTQPNAQ